MSRYRVIADFFVDADTEDGAVDLIDDLLDGLRTANPEVAEFTIEDHWEEEP
jgi:hypothetical protein